jgi:hypothetical protein
MALVHDPTLKYYDNLSMNNPFSGCAYSQLLGTGVKVEGIQATMTRHHWIVTDCGTDPVDGSCGSPILDDNRRVVGFFQFKQNNSAHCYAVSVEELRKEEYEICAQEIEF